MASAWFPARKGSLDDFLAVYDPAVDPLAKDPGGSTLLIGSLRNPDPQARVDIATRLLDDGADATAATSPSSDSINVFHSLWGRRQERELDRELPLVARLLDAGADIDHRSPRFGLPIVMMIAALSPDEVTRTWDVIVAHSRPDLSLEGTKKGTPLGRSLLSYPPLVDRVRAYAAESGQVAQLEEPTDG